MGWCEPHMIRAAECKSPSDETCTIDTRAAGPTRSVIALPFPGMALGG